MAVDNTDLKSIFAMFSEELRTSLIVLYKETNMEDEAFATITGQGLVGAMDSSVKALQVYKMNEATDIQIDINNEKLEQERRATPFKMDAMRINNNTLEQKYFTEQLRNGGVSFDYTFYKSYIDDDGNKIETELVDEDTIVVNDKEYVLFRDYKRVKTKTINAGNSLSTIELSNIKLAEDTDYIKTQKEQLISSVIYNNKIKTMDSLSDLFGTLGAGGLVVPDTGWTAIFGLANELANTSFNADGFSAGVLKPA